MTTDDKTPDPTPARLAEIRERVAAGKFEHTMSDRAALLAHLDALAGPLHDDGGEALAREHYERTTDFMGAYLDPGEAHPLAWHELDEEQKGEHIKQTAIVYHRGHAAGRSEGEAERAERDLEITRLKASYAGVCEQALGQAATIARLTAERDALQRHFDAAAPEHNLVALLDLYEERRATATRERDAMAAELARWCKGAGVTSPEALASLLRDNLRALDAARLAGAQEERRLAILDMLTVARETHPSAQPAVCEAMQALNERITVRGEGQGS